MCISVAEQFAQAVQGKRTVAAPQMQNSSIQTARRPKRRAIYQPATKMGPVPRYLNSNSLCFGLISLHNRGKKETNFYKSRLCTLRDTTHQSINASTEASGRASIKSAFILLEVFFERQSVYHLFIVRRCLITNSRLDSATTWYRSTKSPDTYGP